MVSRSGASSVLPLSQIVPEYRSKNPLVRWLFNKRVSSAILAAQLLGNERILDAGCGEGKLLRVLMHNYPALNAAGVDTNVQVRHLRVPGCTVTVGDITALQFSDGTFDVVFALDVLEHLDNLELPLRELWRVLRPCGRLIITGPTESWLYKLSRFLLKGTFSEKAGPCAGAHYHTVYGIRNFIVNSRLFTLVQDTPIPRIHFCALQRLLSFTKLR